jgi:hypothetical protein
MPDYRKGDRLRWEGTEYRVLDEGVGEEPGEGRGSFYALQAVDNALDTLRVPVEELDALGGEARRILLRMADGAELKYRQSEGGCSFWFLDGSVVGEGGPWELMGRGLVTAAAPGAGPLALTGRGRAVAGRLQGEGKPEGA